MSKSRFRHIFRALRYRNFRLFFIGQSISLVGTWMQQVAMSWLVYKLTFSPFLLGAVTFVSQMPSILISPIAGVLADKWNRRRLLITTQSLSMAQALVLAALTYSGQVRVWQVMVLGLLIGCINSVDVPIRQTFLLDMVEKKSNLSNAIALNSLIFNAARLIGPAVAGVVISLTGEAVCFFLNGLSYLAVIYSLLAMKTKAHISIKDSLPIWGKLQEGFHYAFNCFPIRLILLNLCIMNLMGSSCSVLLPVFAKESLSGDSATFGFLVAAAGIGALLSTVYLAAQTSIIGLATKIAVSSALFSSSIIFFSLSHVLWLSMTLLAFAAFWLMTCTASCSIILQTITDDDKRGRILSFYSMAFMVSVPVGSLLVGTLANKTGAVNTVIIQACCCLIGTLYFALKLPAFKKELKPIYARLGIIPPPPSD